MTEGPLFDERWFPPSPRKDLYLLLSDRTSFEVRGPAVETHIIGAPSRALWCF